MTEAAMDEELLQPDSDFLPNQSGRKRLDNGGDDRISELPNEILFVILSFLPLRRAASTTVLSSRWLDLWKKIPNLKFNLEFDRISQLPDQIISVILSFLPWKRAAATSVLSSRWSESWKHTLNLVFDYRTILGFEESNLNFYQCAMLGLGNDRAIFDTSTYIEMVNSILQSHKARSLKLFRIHFFVDKSAKWAVTKWLEFVFLREVESLEFNFLSCVDRDKVVLGESLREISMICGDPRRLIFFQSLKSLLLVTLQVSSKDVELFLINCPLLEQLMLRDVVLTSDLEVCGPVLKHFEISRCTGRNSIKVCAPYLTSIAFGAEGKLLFENVPRLVKAAFCVNSSEFVMQHFAPAASCHISQLQFLKISLSCPKAFWMTAFSQMPNLKKLVINCCEMYNHSLLPITRIIWASPRLEEFRLQFSLYRKDPTEYTQDLAVGGRSPHQHLKVFHLHLPYHRPGVNDRVFELLTYTANNCVALRLMEVVVLDVSDLTVQRLRSQVPDSVQLSIRSW